MFKKTLVIILCLIMVCTSMLCVNATVVPTISIGSGSVSAGKLCSISVSIANNPGIVAARLVVVYDATALTLISAGDSGLLNDKTETPTPEILYWEDAAATVDNTANGVIATLTFKANEDAQTGKYPVTVGYETGDIYNVDLEDVNFTVSGGFINVIGNTCYHTETEWQVTTEPSPKSDGVRSEICISCGTVVNTETIPATDNETGTSGNILWSYNASLKSLTLSGEGNVPDFTSSYLSQPWYLHKTKITSLKIDATAESIGSYAFAKHTALNSAVLSDEIKIVGEYAFWDCKELTSVNLPSSLQEIGTSAFSNCVSLENIELSSELVSIGDSAFAHCNALTGVLRLEKVLYLGDEAFVNTGLYGIVLSDNIGYVGVANYVPIYCRAGSNGADMGYEIIGDMDNNGTLSVTDLAGLRAEMMNDLSYSVKTDFNEDDNLNALDIVRLKKTLAYGG